MANRVHSKGPFRHVEYEAGGTIAIGMLLTLGSANTVIAHATEGGRSEALFADVDALQGRSKDTGYVVTERVTIVAPGKGTEVNVLIEDGQNVAIGDEIISAGNGKLKIASDLESGETLTQVIGIATKAIDLTGSNTSDTLSPIRIL